MNPEMKRKFLIFVLMGYGCLVLIGVQLWLRFDGHATAALAFGVVPLVGFVVTFWWARRIGLLARGERE